MGHSRRTGSINISTPEGGTPVGLVRAVDVDVAFAAAFAVDSAWLWASGQVAGVRAPLGRLALAAAVGALADVFSLLPAGWPLRTWPGRLIGSLVAVTLAYGGHVRPRAMWRLLGFFYATGILMAGAGLMLAPAGGGALVSRSGGTLTLIRIPAAVSWPAALGAALALAGGRLLLQAALAWQRLRHGTREIEITMGGGRVRVTALLDTGCRLREPLSGCPVVVTEAAALAAVLPAVLVEAAGAPGSGERLSRLPADWVQRVRLVPYQAVGTPAGLLLAVETEALVVAGQPASAVRSYVALSPTPLDPSGTFRALLPAALFGEDRPDASGRDCA